MSRIENIVIDRIVSRAEQGLAKYGTDMTREDFTELQWLRHAQEEALDLAIYLERLIQDKLKIQDDLK